MSAVRGGRGGRTIEVEGMEFQMWMAEGEKKCQKVSEYETERLCFSIDHCPLDDLVEYHYQYHCVRVPSLGGNWNSTRPLIDDILPSFVSVIALATVLQSPSACICRQVQRHLWWG